MKIVFLGGGALRLLGAVDEILRLQDTFANPEMVFVDTDMARAQTVASLATKMPSAHANPPITHATNDLDRALDGADFVYCAIRVGGVVALERDARIGAAHGYHGYDDFGPSGLMLTARTVPVMLDIAQQMEKLCPDAWLLIFTNPIATLVDAVTRYSSVRSVGLCDGVNNFAWDIDALFEIGVPCPDLKYSGGGLNHLSWIMPDASYKSRPVMDMIWEQWDELPQRRNAKRCAWPRLAPLVKVDRVMPLNNSHQYHFFYHDVMARQMAESFATSSPNALRSARQDRATDQAAELARQDTIDNFWEQESLRKCRAGPLGVTGVKFMRSVHEDAGDELIVTIPNHGHIIDLPGGTPVEAPTRVWSDRLEPVGIDPIPVGKKGLVQSVAHHQRLAVDASVTGDRDDLFRALMAEPTIRSIERAQPMFDELWAAHKAE